VTVTRPPSAPCHAPGVAVSSTPLAKLVAMGRRYGVARTSAGIVRLAALRTGRPGFRRVVTARDGLSIEFESPSQLIPSLVVCRELIEPEYELLRRVLGPESLFVDVGGAIGTYTVAVARLTGARVHVFEPADRNVATLRTNLAANGVDDRVTVHEAAVADYEGSGTVTTGDNLFLGHLERARSGGSVAVTTLTAFADAAAIDRIDALKLDVEGGESEVLRGAQPLLDAGRIGLVVAELSERSRPAYAGLGGHGFSWYWYDAPQRRLLPVGPELDGRARPSSLNSNVVAVHESAAGAVEARLHPPDQPD
jgi:FkbM family methyltransferase